MRKLASFEDTARTLALDQQLSAAEIPTTLRRSDLGKQELWIVAEQDLEKAQAVLREFLAGSGAEPRANPVSGGPAKPQVAAPSRWQGIWSAMRMGPVTSALLILSIAVAIYTSLGSNEARVEQLTIARLAHGYAPGWDWNPWHDLQAGQWWRLFTPILLHFHPFHILFNAFWLRDLGIPAERFQGSGRYALFMLWAAAVSNVAQLIFGHSPNFGGLSGVVYALIGYLWARGRADPSSGITLPNSWVIFFVGWMALGFTGLLNGLLGGGVANYCHLGGFAAGVLYGYIAAKIALGRAH
jgi:GlpG protein